jgi:hypothetical protein
LELYRYCDCSRRNTRNRGQTFTRLTFNLKLTMTVWITQRYPRGEPRSTTFA